MTGSLWTLLGVCVGTGERDAGRPELSGEALVAPADAGAFRVHYTLEGRDGVSARDEDGNSRPDTIDQVVAGLELGRRAFEDEGWRRLTSDDGRGGDAAIDVYVRSLDINGYAHPERAPDGSWSCWMEVDGSLGNTGALLESVTLHELHHCVQYRYTADHDPWIYEATATWQQYRWVVDPALTYALGVLFVERLAAADQPLDQRSGRMEYASFLFLKYWTERGGFFPEAAAQLWEALAETPAADGWLPALHQAAVDRFGESFAEAFATYAKYNAFACARDDGGHYLADPLPCIAAAQVPIQAWDGQPLALSHEKAPFTAAYLELHADGDPRPFTVRCQGQATVELVSLTEDGVAVEADRGKDASASLRQALDPAGRALVVISAGEDPLEVSCSAERTDLPPEPEAAAKGDSPPATGCHAGRLAPGFGALLLAAALSRRRGVGSGPRRSPGRG